MKKLLLIALCIVSCGVFAADNWYESLAGAEARLATENLPVSVKSRAMIGIAYYSNPTMSYAELKDTVFAVYTENYPAGTDIEKAYLFGLVDAATRLDYGKFIDELIADTTVHSNRQFKIDYMLGNLTNEKIQAYSATIEDKDAIYKELALSNLNVSEFKKIVNQYIKDNVLNEDTTILKVFYAVAYDKLTNAQWKPIITKLALNLKRRGVEVQ